MEKVFKKEMPIIVGLAGKAGSGKTSVAEFFVPKGSIDVKMHGVKFDHIFFALPLYELASIKKSIKGVNALNRQLYSIHETLFDIYGNSALGYIPHYFDFVDKVEEIFNLPIEPEGTKPRSFLQKAGDICRDGNPDCFAMWGISKSMKLYQQYYKSLAEDEDESPFVVFISDVRFVNEAERILKQPNGVVICFDADQKTLDERILKRDGRMMSEEQKSHKSEQQIEDIKAMSTHVIRTDNMSVEDQAMETLKILKLVQGQYA
jgi:dephospho-CoA kinase